MILRRRILVIDDEPKIRHLLPELLSHDYDILTAANGSDALEQLESHMLEEMSTDPGFMLYIHINSKWILELSVNTKTVSLLTENRKYVFVTLE